MITQVYLIKYFVLWIFVVFVWLLYTSLFLYSSFDWERWVGALSQMDDILEKSVGSLPKCNRVESPEFGSPLDIFPGTQPVLSEVRHLFLCIPPLIRRVRCLHESVADEEDRDRRTEATPVFHPWQAGEGLDHLQSIGRVF